MTLIAHEIIALSDLNFVNEKPFEFFYKRSPKFNTLTVTRLILHQFNKFQFHDPTEGDCN